MRVLVACEYSGTVREAFAALGHDAWSCDILPTERPGNHYQCDVREVLSMGWDLAICHPPCTYLSNSGVQWLYRQPGRWELMREGAEFFKLFLNAPIERVAIENPIMHKYAREIIGAKQTQVVQPWMFGHTEQKSTALWLKGLSPLKETNNVRAAMMKLTDRERQRMFHLPPSADRAKLRSMTYQGIANAMAQQWGGQMVHVETWWQLPMFDMPEVRAA